MKASNYIFISLIILFTVLTNIVGSFIFPLIVSVLGLFFSFLIEKNKEKELSDIKNKLGEVEKNLHNLQLSLKLQKKIPSNKL